MVGVHCENTEVIPVFREPLQAAGRNDLPAWDEQSPGFLETENVFRVAYFGEKTGCAVNIVHMSALESLDLVRRMRHPSRPPIHVETCIHYLSLSENAPLWISMGDRARVWCLPRRHAAPRAPTSGAACCRHAWGRWPPQRRQKPP